MTPEEKQREEDIQDIIAILRNSDFSFEVKVTEKPTGVKIIYEVTQEQMDEVMEELNEKEENKKSISTGNDGADELLEKMCNELAQGGNVEEIADKYVKCSTPELRDKLIAGLKAIQWLNDSISNISEQKSS